MGLGLVVAIVPIPDSDAHSEAIGAFELDKANAAVVYFIDHTPILAPYTLNANLIGENIYDLSACGIKT